VKRIYQGSALVGTAIGLFVAWHGYRLKIEGLYGPGPGFFPFWIGLGITLLSLIWLVQATWRPVPPMPTDFVPERPQLLGLIVVVAAMSAFAALLRPLGFNLAMLGLLLFLFFVIDRKHAVAKIVIAVLGSFGVHYLFEEILRVPLPYAALPWLQQLGF